MWYLGFKDNLDKKIRRPTPPSHISEVTVPNNYTQKIWSWRESTEEIATWKFGLKLLFVTEMDTNSRRPEICACRDVGNGRMGP